MIGIQLTGGIGNQMFQYAAARTLAEQLNVGLLLSGRTSRRHTGFIGRTFGLDRNSKAPIHVRRENGALRRSFGFGPGFIRGRLTELAAPCFKPILFPHFFTPKRYILPDRSPEDFDPAFFDQKSGTWLKGYFQSAGYFGPDVCDWFRPTGKHRAIIDQITATWPSGDMIAMHIRRGDYLKRSWRLDLPRSYYQDALKRLPSLPLAIFTDDPKWAAQKFPRAWISRDNAPVIDLHLISQCRYNILSASTFSWWSGWLNAHPNKVVIAPRYHFGWRIGDWVPGGSKNDDWTYIDALDRSGPPRFRIGPRHRRKRARVSTSRNSG